ncbi:sigma-70 family RNA polymerase sigma factor [Cytophagaceae bacterium DM2B3-1]|uniref:Sigma-70 family RNA polymerase sigma factor n=1 Tax=Xanthocytophaga flava TaxID=3048013 RepID=A0ABT7CDT7_9BACT|nr:sigma-70 family RNA polymerase sigma factor [Xanthocytophaga flavus]MDJ1472699.1 sigma-70 family RNA polymerase sigma factor [Xanthocytophaga flavus]MDJ1491879.1 sigma-70 family RNA polymerase sigma factor [Xanthocytophaga flavus]
MSKQVLQQQDGILWNQFRAGELTAFTELYNNYVQTLYNYGKRFTPDKALIEDSIQDLFIELWNKKDHLSDTDSPKYFLMKSLRNKMLRKLEREHKYILNNLSEDYDFEVELSYEFSLVSEQASIEQRQHLQQALQQLTKRQREVIFLKFYENLSYEEIASLMAIELRSVYNLVSKAIDVIKRYISRLFLILVFLIFSPSFE